MGAQFDLGPHWALRLPIVVAVAVAVAGRSSRADYAELDFIPGILYRLRKRAEEGFTPYVGAGVKVGGFGASRTFLGKPPVSSTGLGMATLFGEQGYLDDANFESTIAIGAEARIGPA